MVIMRIPLKIFRDRILLLVNIRCNERYRLASPFLPVEFLIDTGSNETFLNYNHITKYNLPINLMEKAGREINLVNGTYELLKMQTKGLSFKDENGETKLLSVQSINVARPKMTSEKNLAISYQIPAILGLDFLKENKLILFVDMHNNLAYLESKD